MSRKIVQPRTRGAGLRYNGKVHVNMRVITGFVVSVAAGCPGGGDFGAPDSALPMLDGIVEMGTGMVEWQAIAEGEELPLYRGPQGGYHNLRPGDPSRPSAENPATRFFAYRDDRPIDLPYPAWRYGYARGADGWWVWPSGHVFEIRADEVPAVYGEPVRLVVHVSDGEEVATDERTVRLRPAP